MRSLEPAATWTASTAAPRRGCQGGCLRVNPDPGVIFTLPANRGRSPFRQPWTPGHMNCGGSGSSSRLQRLTAYFSDRGPVSV